MTRVLSYAYNIESLKKNTVSVFKNSLMRLFLKRFQVNLKNWFCMFNFLNIPEQNDWQ